MSMGGPQGRIPLPEPLQSPEGNLEPFDWFREQREAGPVQWDPDRGCWDVFTYAGVEQVLSDPQHFANEPIVSQNTTFKDTLLALDPPEHTRKRSLVEKHFSKGAVADYEADIRETAEQLVADALGDGDAGSFDVVSEFGSPLPISTIATILGASGDIRDRLKEVSDEAVAAPSLAGPGDMEEFLQAQGEAVFGIGELVNEIILEKRESPGEDLVSDLVARDHGLSHYELLRLCGLLIVAGHITTTNLITNTVWILAQRADAFATVRQAAREGDEQALGRAIEEALRFRSPAQMAVRVATEDVTVEGADIAAGERVVSWIQAANRDPAVFDDPGTYDPTREENPNISFGRGPHACLGLHLARLEGRVGTEVLFDRVESLELVDTEYDPVEAPFLHGVQALPVRYERAVGTHPSS